MSPPRTRLRDLRSQPDVPPFETPIQSKEFYDLWRGREMLNGPRKAGQDIDAGLRNWQNNRPGQTRQRGAKPRRCWAACGHHVDFSRQSEYIGDRLAGGGHVGGIVVMKHTLSIAGAAIALITLAAPLSAHHANSAYDRNQTITVSGTVIKWQFINPHAGLWLTVEDEQGNVQEWSGEFQGVLDLYRHFGWNKETFKPGDVITITGNPSRSGDLNFSTIEVTFADGRKVNVRNAPD